MSCHEPLLPSQHTYRHGLAEPRLDASCQIPVLACGCVNEVTDYFHGALVREFKKQKWNVVDAAGDDVTRYRAAITGISAEGGLGSNPINYMPAVFVLRAASGKDSTKANINMESYYSDSLTGQTLVEIMQAATGKSVYGDQITLANLKGAVDQWAKKAAEGFTRARNAQM